MREFALSPEIAPPEIEFCHTTFVYFYVEPIATLFGIFSLQT